MPWVETAARMYQEVRRAELTSRLITMIDAPASSGYDGTTATLSGLNRQSIALRLVGREDVDFSSLLF
jgi:hypothetical protein